MRLNLKVDKQVAEVLKWLETAYDKKYALPICFDASRLYKQLHLVYAQDRQATIERFTRLYHGEDRDLLRAMLSTVGEEETFAYWMAELNHYESLKQWGAQEILRAVLEATESVELLIDFVEKANTFRSAAQQPFEMPYLLKKLNKWLNELQQEVALLEENLDNDPNLPEDGEMETASIENYPLHEQYIIRQAIQQQEDFEMPNQHLPELKVALKVLIENALIYMKVKL